MILFDAPRRLGLRPTSFHSNDDAKKIIEIKVDFIEIKVDFIEKKSRKNEKYFFSNMALLRFRSKCK